MSINQLIISKHILSKGLILWTLTLEHFALTFPTIPTNSSSSPFSTFWHVLCFWPGYLVSFSSCFGTTGSALLTKSNSSFQTIAFPSLTQENKIRTLLWPQKREFICLWRNVHLQADHLETLPKQCMKRSCSDTLLGSQVTCAAAGTHSSGKPRAMDLPVLHTQKLCLLGSCKVPSKSTGLTVLCRFWNKWTATGFLYNCYINPEHSWEKLEKTRP